MDEFDGVFERDDVVRLAFIDFMDHGRDGGGFPLVCATGDDDQAMMFGGDPFEDFGGFEVIERQDIAGQPAEDDRKVATLAKDIGSEAVLLMEDEREVTGSVIFEIGPEVRFTAQEDFSDQFSVIGPQESHILQGRRCGQTTKKLGSNEVTGGKVEPRDVFIVSKKVT